MTVLLIISVLENLTKNNAVSCSSQIKFINSVSWNAFHFELTCFPDSKVVSPFRPLAYLEDWPHAYTPSPSVSRSTAGQRQAGQRELARESQYCRPEQKGDQICLAEEDTWQQSPDSVSGWDLGAQYPVCPPSSVLAWKFECASHNETKT